MKKQDGVAGAVSTFFIVDGLICYVFGDPSMQGVKTVLSLFLVIYGVAFWFGRNW